MTPLFPAWFQVVFQVGVVVAGGGLFAVGVWQWVAGWFQARFDEDEAVFKQIENEERV